MVGASKILTVSYGTFSCTLEGFDEPFSTMKAIAEYFRDLAADDRYFGAEPPQPDAEMLHRIAEREIQRRVEAKVQDNGVVLKAGALAAPEGAPVAAPAAAPEAAPAPAAEAPAAKPAPAVAPAAAAAVAASAAPESIAAKLKRIRAAVENARSEAAVAEVPVAEEAEEAENYDDGENAGDLVPAAAMPAVFEDAEEEPAELASEEEAAAEAGADEPAEEEMAAPEMAADETEEEVAEEVAGDDGALAALIQAVSAGHAEEPAGDEVEAEAEAEVETEAEAEAEETAEAEPAEGLPAPRGTGRVIKVRRIEPVEPGGKTVFETSYDSDEEDAAEAEAPASTLAPEAEAELQAELAEVEREMAAAEGAGAEELEAEATEAEAEEIPEAEAEEIEAAAEEDWQPEAELAEEAEEAEDWAPEDEPELAAEEVGEETVAEAEEEDEAEAQGTAAEDEDLFAPVAGTDRSRLTLTDRVDDEAALDRLMRQTANELDEPAAKRRQATLAHLKAAVVATQADKDAGAEAARKEAADLDRYRDDLAHVVRPRRPVAGQAGTARPMTQDRPAPLMLVSEQRVDAPSHSDRVVIRPRRVTSNALAIEEADEMEQIDDTQSIFANSKSFAEFAERIGATELPDLLEAAAAYAACVEGRPHFSRPQILKSAVEAAEMPVSREQSLRSFGMLLRQGKITKVKRGQFAIAETSRYLPEARKIGH